MKKENIEKKKRNYLKKMTDDQIYQILELNRLLVRTDLPENFVRTRNSDGEYVIIVKCENVKNKDYEYILNNPAFSFLKKFAKPVFDDMNTEIIEIGNFYMIEQLSLRDKDSVIKHNQEMTDILHQFMEEEFGTRYVEDKNAYFKKLHEDLEYDDIEK